jgi:hypothetical protein
MYKYLMMICSIVIRIQINKKRKGGPQKKLRENDELTK